MIVPTARLLAIAFAGAIAAGLAGTAGGAVLVAAIWLACVTALAIVDAYFTPSAADLVWERRHDAKLSLGADNPVVLAMRNRSPRPARFRWRDAVPPLLVARGESGTGECAPGGEWTARYTLFPVHRGDYEFGPLSARYLGPLGLAWKQSSRRLPDAVKVYPNLLAVRRYEALVRSGHLEQMGLRRARRLGAGTEFDRLREYTPDDEYRRINWTATARRHSPVAVEYQTERSQNIMLLVDAGRLMSTQVPYEGELDAAAGENDSDRGPQSVVPALTRLDHAVNSALLLAYVSQSQGDRVGLMAFSDRVLRFVKPGPGRRQFLTLTEVLYNVQPDGTEADYGDALAYLSAQRARRSLVVIFTDIAHAAAAESLVHHLAYLARRHLPLVVTMRDPAVERLAIQPITTSQSVYERAVARSLLDSREETLSKLRRQGALTLDVPADQLSASVINRYLEIKAWATL
jgi:uncharacterized protein (DUF58 family)